MEYYVNWKINKLKEIICKLSSNVGENVCKKWLRLRVEMPFYKLFVELFSKWKRPTNFQSWKYNGELNLASNSFMFSFVWKENPIFSLKDLVHNSDNTNETLDHLCTYAAINYIHTSQTNKSPIESIRSPVICVQHITNDPLSQSSLSQNCLGRKDARIAALVTQGWNGWRLGCNSWLEVLGHTDRPIMRSSCWVLWMMMSGGCYG